jgi:hypothetical protein
MPVVVLDGLELDTVPRVLGPLDGQDHVADDDLIVLMTSHVGVFEARRKVMSASERLMTSTSNPTIRCHARR